MAEMPSHFKAFLKSPLYEQLARGVVLPWALQGVRPSGRALEIGSGGGAMAGKLLSRFPDLELLATDYDPEMVAATRQSLRSFGDRAQVQPADAADLPFEDDRFDVVFAFAMFHHAGDWEQAVGEAVRVLRPGGRLVGYDMLEGSPLHGGRGRHRAHAGHGHPHPDGRPRPDRGANRGRMIRSAQQLDERLRSLPVTGVRVRRSAGSLAVRFLATKAGADSPG